MPAQPRRFLRRYDDALMQPPAPGGAVDAALLARVRAWCAAGALPRTTLPLAVACIAPHPALDAVACAIDGSQRLAGLGRWHGRAWRAQVLLQDHWPGRTLLPDDPWDCGWWRAGALQAAAAFRPRRCTLLMVREPGLEEARALLAALQPRDGSPARAVRVLVVTGALASSGLQAALGAAAL